MATQPQQSNPNTTLPQGWGGSESQLPGMPEGWGGSTHQIPTATTPPQSSVVVTGNEASQQFTHNSGELTNMLANLNQAPSPEGEKTLDSEKNDPYMKMLDDISKSSNASTKALIASIQAQRSAKQGDVNTQYDNYKRGLQLLGIQHNKAQATPDLLMGHIMQAENEQRAKINEIDIEINKALMDAETAQTEKNLSVLREKNARIKELKNAKNEYLKSIADQMGYEAEIAEAQAGQIYDQLKNLGEDEKEAYMVAVAKKFNIPLGALVKAVGDEKIAREKGSKSSSSSSGGYTSQEKRKLRQAGIDPSDIEAADNFLYGENKGEVSEAVDAQYFKNNYSTKQLHKLALGLGIERDKNFTRQDEINKMMDILEEKIQEAKADGFSDEEIIEHIEGYL